MNSEHDDYVAGIGLMARAFHRLHEKYDELIMAVEKKYSNESKHDTALRYIRERENSGNNVPKEGSNQEG